MDAQGARRLSGASRQGARAARQLTSAQLVEPKTAAKDRWSLLELEDPVGKDAKSSLVRLLDATGKPIAEIVIGKTRSNAFGAGRGGIYVRRPNETQTWLASGEPNIAIEAKDWVDQAVYKADVAKLTRVTVEHPREVPIVVEKGSAPDAKFALTAVPEGLKLKQTAGVEQIALAYGSIDLEDVRKLDATPTGDNVTVTKTESTDGVTVTFRLRRESAPNAASWLSFTATGEGEAKKAADEINAKAGGWEFKIPEWKADQIGKRAADLFETS